MMHTVQKTTLVRLLICACMMVQALTAQVYNFDYRDQPAIRYLPKVSNECCQNDFCEKEWTPPISNRIDEYRLKIGDTLLISIYGEEGSEREVRVDARGTLTYLLVEAIPASGRTIAEVRADLEEKLKGYYRHVLLALTPITFTGEFYTILGEVNVPGSKLIQGNPTILTAICDSGGFTMNEFRDQFVDFADLDHSFLARQGQYIPVDFNLLVKEGDLKQDIELEAGDFLYIHSKKISQVYIIGEVRQSMTYDYLETLTLTQAIAEAGGFTLEASSRIAVIRGSLSCPIRYLIDFNLIQRGCACDFELQPGDIVYVPPRTFTYLRFLFRDAVRYFVSTVASDAGHNAYIKMDPGAFGTPGPVNTIGGGGGVVIVP